MMSNNQAWSAFGKLPKPIKKVIRNGYKKVKHLHPSHPDYQAALVETQKTVIGMLGDK